MISHDIKRDVDHARRGPHPSPVPRANTTITPLACPLVWAREANAFDCVSVSSACPGRSNALSDLLQTVVFTYTSGEDICASTSSYYKAAIPVVRLTSNGSPY